jgi:hypothetical membrane protein
MSRKYLLVCGVLAPLLYVGAVILGGLLRPGYSHVAHAISELIAAGAPNTTLLNPLFTLYDLLLAIFGTGLLCTVIARPQQHAKRSGALGAIALVVAGLLGVLMNLFFPQDPGGPPVTVTGTVHVVLAGVLSLGTMLAILCTGLWLRQMPGLRAYWRYSLASLVVIFVSGGLGAAAIATSSPYLGLVERVTIGAFIQWVFVIALRLSMPSPATVRSVIQPHVSAAR